MKYLKIRSENCGVCGLKHKVDIPDIYRHIDTISTGAGAKEKQIQKQTVKTNLALVKINYTMSYINLETKINKSEGFSSDPDGHSNRSLLKEYCIGYSRAASGTVSSGVLKMLNFNSVQSSRLINE